MQKCSTADECAEDIGAAAKAGAVSRSLKLQAEEKVISSSYVTHEIPKEINTSHLPQHHAGFLLTKSGQDSHNGGVTEAKEQKIPPVPIKDSVPNKPRENVRSEGMEYTIYNRERMLGVREHMGKTHTQKAPKLRTIQNERLIRFVEACVRKLNKKHDKETLNMLRGAYASGNTNKHTYKSSFVNITKKQKRWHKKKRRNRAETNSMQMVTHVLQDWTSKGGWLEAGQEPQIPRGVVAGARLTSLDASLLVPDWSKIGLSEYRRHEINKQICAYKKQTAKNTKT